MIIYDGISHNLSETFAIAANFAKHLSPNNIVYLYGDLGSGKTTFMRGLLAAFGYTKAVKSPTYAILEPYPELPIPIYHFDLYRLAVPGDLELIGIRDYLRPENICCFEWPEKGLGFIPKPNFNVKIDIINKHKRKISIVGAGPCASSELKTI